MSVGINWEDSSFFLKLFLDSSQLSLIQKTIYHYINAANCRKYSKHDCRGLSLFLHLLPRLCCSSFLKGNRLHFSVLWLCHWYFVAFQYTRNTRTKLKRRNHKLSPCYHEGSCLISPSAQQLIGFFFCPLKWFSQVHLFFLFERVRYT